MTYVPIFISKLASLIRGFYGQTRGISSFNLRARPGRKINGILHINFVEIYLKQHISGGRERGKEVTSHPQHESLLI